MSSQRLRPLAAASPRVHQAASEEKEPPCLFRVQTVAPVDIFQAEIRAKWLSCRRRSVMNRALADVVEVVFAPWSHGPATGLFLRPVSHVTTLTHKTHKDTYGEPGGSLTGNCASGAPSVTTCSGLPVQRAGQVGLRSARQMDKGQRDSLASGITSPESVSKHTPYRAKQGRPN
jgi:hypothetical protein